ncbi:FYVE zinc finger domain-containing protein [Sarocladium implicatum]|nr:FYVE zinc finger domain-containing protein [Sarocladium implicatum]
MSGRKLGGGRILGSGKGLAPPAPAVAPRAISPFAPSESTVSIASSSLSPPASSGLPDPGQDIGATISVGAQPKDGGADTGTLVCPICSDEMVTLLQLNRHIDDNHQELPEEAQDEVKTWFDKQVLKAKRFQPLSIINSKIRGLEVFESNESTPVPATAAPGKLPLEGPIDPDELITRSHWQRTTSNDFCTDPTCGKSLGPLVGSINYPADNVSSPSNGSILSPVTSLAGQKNARKLIEQSVVTWEEDNTVSNCPFCKQEFGSWTFRRHHCRICGRVVCADPQTACSSEVGLNVANPQKATEKPAADNGVSVDVRMCRDCKHTIFATRDFAASLTHKPADQRAYETLRQFERGIRQLLPSFHRALLALQPEKSENGEVDLAKPPPTHAQIQEAAKIRKRLVDSFAKYGMAAKRMRDLPGGGQAQQKLQMAVYTYASGFLHTNMLPLKSVPSMLRNSSSSSSSSSRLLPHAQQSSSSLRHSLLASPSTPPTPSATSSSNGHPDDDNDGGSTTSTVVSHLETEERQLRERLVVLEEQKFMVEGMARTAREARRFEEVAALGRNVEELEGEIGELRRRVGEVERRWEGVYG